MTGLGEYFTALFLWVQGNEVCCVDIVKLGSILAAATHARRAAAWEINLHITKLMGFFRAEWFVLFAWSLAACNAATPAITTPTPSSPSSETPIETVLTPTQTSTPTETPAPGRVILLAADSSQPDLQTVLAELSQAENFGFSVQSSLSPGEIGPEVRLVVATAPDPGIASLAAGAPATQFLAVGIPGVEPGSNLSVLAGAGQSPDRVGFLGGYVAAAITAHWRVGVLSVADSPAGQAAQQGFINGVVYFCGLCRPAYPPYVQYPVTAAVPGGSGLVEQQAAVDSLAAQSVNTVFVMGELISPELSAYLASKEMHVISDAIPPLEADPNWVATISGDLIPGIHQIWPTVMAGGGGELVETGLSFEAVNPTWLSPGRQQYVEEILSEINGGYIDTGVEKK